MGEHCSNHTVPAIPTVYAKPIFALGNTALDQLPLEALYNHRDYVDLISAQEFGIEALFPTQTLLCLAIALRPDALDEMETIITGHSSVGKSIAVAQMQDDRITVSIHGCDVSVPNEEDAAHLHHALQNIPKAAWLAVMGAWCTGYRVVLWGTEELL